MSAPLAASGRFRTPTRALTLAIPAVYLLVFAVFALRKGDTDWDQMIALHRLSLWNSKLFGWEKHWNPLMSGFQCFSHPKSFEFQRERRWRAIIWSQSVSPLRRAKTAKTRR